MVCLWILGAVLLAGAASATPTRIVGGEPTTIDKYPSIVQVDYLGVWTGVWGQSCAANILTSRYVLSAAHCFDGPFYSPSYRRIRAGSTYRNTGGVIVNVLKEYNHPSYGDLGYDGDITVVRLDQQLVYTPVVQQAAIPPQDTRLIENLPVVHAGWGAVSQGGSASPQLLDVTIITVDHKLCAERYLTLPTPGIVTENMICAGILDVGGKDACQGDSGGPLYFGNTLVGIVSWGHGCANDTFPGISTNVGSYTQWILDTAEGVEASDVLLDVAIYTINRKLCADRYLTLPRPQVVTENMICASILDVGGKDACQGDFGGPLYFGTTLVGVVSWGEGCANATFPGVSSNVGSYTDWIISTAV